MKKHVVLILLLWLAACSPVELFPGESRPEPPASAEQAGVAASETELSENSICLPDEPLQTGQSAPQIVLVHEGDYSFMFETQENLAYSVQGPEVLLWAQPPGLYFRMILLDKDTWKSESPWSDYYGRTNLMNEIDESLTFSVPYPYRVGSEMGEAIDYWGPGLTGCSVFRALDNSHYFWAYGYGDVSGGTHWEQGAQIFYQLMDSLEFVETRQGG